MRKISIQHRSLSHKMKRVLPNRPNYIAGRRRKLEGKIKNKGKTTNKQILTVVADSEDEKSQEMEIDYLEQEEVK